MVTISLLFTASCRHKGSYLEEKAHTVERIFYTYTPENTINSFNISVDSFRMLNVEWNKMPLVRQWGEFYGDIPNPWKRMTRNENNVFNPHGIYGISRDIMVRVNKSSEHLEYIWMVDNIEKDFLQLNRVVATPTKILAEMIFYFRKTCPEELTFHPVLMPSVMIPGGRMRETAILNKNCTVSYKDGKTETVVYPDKKTAFKWLSGNVRQLTFHLKKGKISYKFSSNDSKMELSFAGSSLFPIAYQSQNRAIVGKLKAYPTIGTPIVYSMEIEINDSKAAISPVKPSEILSSYIPFSISLSHPDGIYLPDEDIKIEIAIDNTWNKKPENLQVKYKVINYDNEIVSKGQYDCEIPGATIKKQNASIDIKEAGIFNMDVSLYKGNKIINNKRISFTKVLAPIDFPAEKTFFGSHGCSYMMRPPARAYTSDEKAWVESHFAALHKIGIKEVRVLDGNLAWDRVEPVKGEFSFSPATDELLELADKYNITLRFYHVFTTRQPDWVWEDGRIFKVFHDSFKAPKKAFDEEEWKLYENYVYQIAKRYKGKIKFYEIANEPYQLRPWHPVRNEYIKAFNRGIKRGDPEAKVLAGSVFNIKSDTFNKLKQFLKYKDSYKDLDIISPHYFLSGQTIRKGVNLVDENMSAPENRLEDVKRLVKIATKYNLEIFNGEDGRKIIPENIFPAEIFQDWQKVYINNSVRNYLLHKRFKEIKRVCQCWGMGGYVGGFLNPSIFNDYNERIRGESFWGAGGNVLPWATAHATLAHFTEGASFQKQISRRIRSFYCYYFKRKNENIAAVWMKDGQACWVVDLAKEVKTYNIMGKQISRKPKDKIKVSGEPFYITAKDMSEKDFVKILSSGHLIPNKYIAIENVKLSKDKKAFEVSIRNLTLNKVTPDCISLTYDMQHNISLQNPVLKSNQINVIKFPVKEIVKGNMLVSVNIKMGKQEYEYEDIVLYPSVKGVNAKGYIAALRVNKGIKIDGNLSEWDKAPWLVFDSENQLCSKKSSNPWNGPRDLSARSSILWDDKYLYFACEVTDDKYYNPYNDRKSTWAGDSIQFAIDSKPDNLKEGFDKDVIRLNFALSKDGPKIFRDTFGKRREICLSDNGIVKDIKFAVIRKGGKFFYELALPLSELKGIRVGEGTTVKYCLLINDSDNGSDRIWFESSKGLGGKKNTKHFRNLVFCK